MKKAFRKPIAGLLIICLIGSVFVGCGGKNRGRTLNVGYMTGPTGMGMAQMIADGDQAYSFTAFSDVTLAQSALTSGAIDIVCLPTNSAAVLNEKVGNSLCVLAVNCLGSLFIVSDEAHMVKSVQDLEGQTVYASVPNSTTGPILRHILDLYGVHAEISFTYEKRGNAEILATHDMLSAALLSGDIGLAVMPEPKVTATQLQGASMSPARYFSVDLNLSDLWSEKSDSPLTMGCLVARRDYVLENKEKIARFLTDYEASVRTIASAENPDTAAQTIVDAGVLPKLPIAKKSLANLDGAIVYLIETDMKNALKGFYDAIGLKQPDDGFFYER